MARGTLYAGTSGYSYKEWKPAFYPADLPAAKFLEFYAGKLRTVEINNTFYKFPSAGSLEGWRNQTPAAFTFAVKAPQTITHEGRLKDVQELTRDFVTRCAVLGEKLGPILFQLPPFLRREDDRLAAFLAALPAGARYAMEFRHASWFDDAVLRLLADANAALCVSEGEKLDSPRVATTGFCYVRLRKKDYGDADLADWRGWIDEQRAAGRDVFAYLKHDEKGESPERALRLLETP